MPKRYFVYIVTNRKRGVLYVGSTSALKSRIYNHKNKVVSGFTNKYNLNKFVYYEEYDEPGPMVSRER